MTNTKDIKTVRQLIHDMRSRLGIIQAFLEHADDALTSEDRNMLHTNALQSYYEVVKLVTNLSTEVNNLSYTEGTSAPVHANPIARNHMEFEYAINDDDKTNVLVVDDDPQIRNLFSTELTKRGLNVTTLERGEDLLNSKLDLKKFKTAVVDYEFENSSLDGFDIIEYLKTQKIKHIHLCTGCYDDPDVVKHAYTLGIVSIISKPIPKNIWDMVGKKY